MCMQRNVSKQGVVTLAHETLLFVLGEPVYLFKLGWPCGEEEIRTPPNSRRDTQRMHFCLYLCFVLVCYFYVHAEECVKAGRCDIGPRNITVCARGASIFV